MHTNTHIYAAQTLILIRLFVCKNQDFCEYTRRSVHVSLFVCDCVCVRNSKCVYSYVRVFVCVFKGNCA